MSGAGRRTDKESRKGDGTPMSPKSPTAESSSRSGTATGASVQNKNLDIGFVGASLMAGYNAPLNLPKRPKEANSTGRPAQIKLNTWDVAKFPEKKVYQYDVQVGRGEEKRGLIMTIWETSDVQQVIGKYTIFDGNRLAWSNQDLGNQDFQVDLDRALNRPPRTDRRTGQPVHDIHRVRITFTKTVDFASLEYYLKGRADFSNSVLEAMNFLDHLIREGPSQRLYPIKRNFFGDRQDHQDLGGGMEAYKGTHASVRAVLGLNGPCLSVNVDVANSAFWKMGQLHKVVAGLLHLRDPVEMNRLSDRQKEVFKSFKRVRMAFMTTYERGPPKEVFKKCRLEIFTGITNTTAKTQRFRDERGQEVSVQQYFRTKYGVDLGFPDLPLVRTAKPDCFLPMESLWIRPFERYQGKLNDRQTSEMLRFAVKEPATRWKDIEARRGDLKWDKDPYFAAYGLKINETATTVNAKVLPAPTIAFGNQNVNPSTRGNWDLKNKKFAASNPVPLKAWGVAVFTGSGDSASRENVKAFMERFMSIYVQHGGRVENQHAQVVIQANANPAVAIEELHTQVKAKYNAEPQMLFFVLPRKDTETYQRLKKSADCRFGTPSQCMLAAHVIKCAPQYCSNVAMKVNAKLGGITTRTTGFKASGAYAMAPTLILGADVGHGGAVVDGKPPSVAALSMSWDRQMVKYSAFVATNGYRVEIIHESTWRKLLEVPFSIWLKNISNGMMPGHIIYVRDGVSAGEEAKVISEEMRDIRKILREVGEGKKAAGYEKQIKFTIIIATKRHHVRFFPQNGGDEKGNPLPGTLVETGVTHPYEYDFYLCAHRAIKGTAKPVHYHVLLDEMNMSKEFIQNQLYEGSYQYVRSTTAVSLFPAVYYAHLATQRGTAHISNVKGPEESSQLTGQRKPGDKKDFEPAPPLLPMAGKNGLPATMWFV